MCHCCPDLPCEILTEVGGRVGGKDGKNFLAEPVANKTKGKGGG